jgi:chromosome partitioning protein
MGARRLIVAMPKGGSGKTATAAAFARGLERAGARVLLVDLDPQGSATAALGAESVADGYGVDELLLKPEMPFSPLRVTPRLHLAPAPREAVTVDFGIRLANQLAGPVAVRDALHRVASAYDYVICDCGPSLGMVAYNAFAAGPILVPVETTRLTVSAVPRLTRAVARLRRELPGPFILAYLPTRHVARQAESRAALDSLRALGGSRVLRTVIPQSTAVALSLAEGVSLYDRRYRESKAPTAYLAAIDEVVSRLEVRHG